MERWMVCWLTLPAVLAKYERVHREGNFSKWGNSLRSMNEVLPLHSLTTTTTTTTALSLGHTRRPYAHEQVNVVWLNRERQDVPALLGALALDHLAAACRYRSQQQRLPPPWAPDQRGHQIKW
jgi:hypothetical protein